MLKRRTKPKRKPARRPEPITPDLISEVRAALDARRQADTALFDLLCRIYKNPFHWRLPRDYFKAAFAWLQRHDPDVKFYKRCRDAMARQIAHDIDDALINGDPPERAEKTIRTIVIPKKHKSALDRAAKAWDAHMRAKPKCKRRR